MLKPIAQPGTVRQIEYQLIHLSSQFGLPTRYQFSELVSQ